MTLQTDTPLVHQSLSITPRQAREVARLHTYGELVLDAPYQRGSVWSIDQRRNLVRSWMLGLPVPAVIINDRATDAWAQANGARQETYAVIDGKQRIEAALAWFDGDLDVPASWFDPDCVETTHETSDGPYVYVDELTVPGRRFLAHRATLPVAQANVATLADEALIFGLVNGAGVAQDEATLERARVIASGNLTDQTTTTAGVTR